MSHGIVAFEDNFIYSNLEGLEKFEHPLTRKSALLQGLGQNMLKYRKKSEGTGITLETYKYRRK